MRMRSDYDNLSDGRFARTRLARALLWLAALALALQLAGTAFHQHDLVDQTPDCVACYAASHFASGMPAAGAALLAVSLAVLYRIALRPLPCHVAPASYLIPPSQAPPRFPLFA
ncbi:MAG TPA: hypothetical protein VEC06_17490 [Paucimonas sp.]|nr:hypothetical protein [Paucimonas sp.]